MSSILLYHHLGLGDHVMCHGIVREYCKKYERVGLFSKPHNYASVAFMYRDLSNITIIKGQESDVADFIKQNQSKPASERYDEIKTIGFEKLNRTTGIPLEWQFYEIAGVPFQKKWDSFFIKRDLIKEQALFHEIAPAGDYAFLHEDASRNYSIKRNLIGKDLKIFTPEPKFTDNFIDYCTIIERAKEIHVIDSSFMFLIDCLPYDNPNQKLYIHRYSRENGEWQLPILKKDWIILVNQPTKLDPIKFFLEDLPNIAVSAPLKTFLKRGVRKIFRTAGWPMGRPKQAPLNSLIMRYVFGKTFAVIHTNDGDDRDHLSFANRVGPRETSIVNLAAGQKTRPSQVTIWHGLPTDEPVTSDFLKRLHSMTTEILILNCPATLKKTVRKDSPYRPTNIQALLIRSGFEIREKHLFPKEACFVCRAVPLV
ncbi:MAG: hypothetical protein WCT02_02955 [Candidatus Paceibacterota bacterium]|jgi:hypothetical protein